MIDIARQTAYDALYRVEKSGAWTNLLIGTLKDLKPIDHSFTAALIMGVVERKMTLDWIIQQFSKRQPDIQCKTVLRMGIYQILFMDRIPDSAACNESVSLIENLGASSKKGFYKCCAEICLQRKRRLISSFIAILSCNTVFCG